MDQAHHHGHTHSHGHVHDPQEKRRQINRISRVIGHLEFIKKMIERDEDCAAVLMQISATRSALNGLGKEIINEHISHCIAHAVEEGDTYAIEEFKKAIQKYLWRIVYDQELILRGYDLCRFRHSPELQLYGKTHEDHDYDPRGFFMLPTISCLFFKLSF